MRIISCMSDFIRIGLNARLFPGNWRPVREEIALAKKYGFRSIQLSVKTEAATEKWLDDSFEETARLLDDAKLDCVMEIRLFLNKHGVNNDGKTPMDILNENLTAIKELPCKYVHWHWAPDWSLAEEEDGVVRGLEQSLIPQLREAVGLARAHNFIFGFEHNEASLRLHADYDNILKTLKAVEGLKFVWDVNHSTAEDLDNFKKLIPYMSVLHLSDTDLPKVNYHLPIGMGKVDFNKYFEALKDAKFNGPGILEIGGIPKSGGFGRDSDESLIDSLEKLKSILNSFS